MKTGLEQRKFGSRQAARRASNSLIRQAKITITSVFKITTMSVCHNDSDKSQRTVVEAHTMFFFLLLLCSLLDFHSTIAYVSAQSNDGRRRCRRRRYHIFFSHSPQYTEYLHLDCMIICHLN